MKRVISTRIFVIYLVAFLFNIKIKRFVQFKVKVSINLGGKIIPFMDLLINPVGGAILADVVQDRKL